MVIIEGGNADGFCSTGRCTPAWPRTSVSPTLSARRLASRPLLSPGVPVRGIEISRWKQGNFGWRGDEPKFFVAGKTNWLYYG
jgi:hypothetical protein